MRITARGVITALAGVAVFLFAWLFRFNDPSGSFAGLTDDHFFYLVRGWQILFGDLPVRDFVDHGAPLYYYLAAAVQVLFGRGTLSELAFSVTMLSLGAALTFWIAARASGWILAGLLGVAFQILLLPRFYNYPKILVYAVGIPLLWRLADRQTTGRRVALAALTVAAFLLRHDHGVFMALATCTLLALLTGLSWRVRLREAVLYAGLTLLFISPYLVFLQVNGGVVSYFEQASAWAERDRGRAPVVWPGLLDEPMQPPEDGSRRGTVGRAVAAVRANAVAWAYYGEIALPVLALLVLAAWPLAGRPRWPHARAKLVTTAVLALLLDAAFLRSPLEARLADPSVPLCVLIAWLVAVAVRACIHGGHLPVEGAGRKHGWPGRGPRLAGAVITLGLTLVLGVAVTDNLYDRLDAATLVGGLRPALSRVSQLSGQIREEWNLATWLRRADRPAAMELSLYLDACTAPTDRVLVQGYLPEVVGLARRGFAGGHADLRPGFFTDPDAQRLTIARLTRQSVPVILLDSGKSYEEFRQAFPLIMAYIDREYRLAATHDFNDRLGITLFVRRDRVPVGTYGPLGWPCYAGGT